MWMSYLIDGLDDDHFAFYASHEGRRLPNPFPLLRSLVGTAASDVALTERVVAGEVSNVVAGLTGDTTVPPWPLPTCDSTNVSDTNAPSPPPAGPRTGSGPCSARPG